MTKRQLAKLKATGRAITANISGKRKKRRAKAPVPPRLVRIEQSLDFMSVELQKLAKMPALVAEMSADKSRLAFMSARHPLLEEEAMNLRAVIREHEGTIARLSKELDNARRK